MVTRKCTDVFRGIFFGLGGGELRWEEATWEDLSIEELLMGEEKAPPFNEGGAGFSSII